MKTREHVNLALKIIGLSGLDGIQVSASNTLLALDQILIKTEISSTDHPRIIKELRRQKLVEISKQADRIKFSLSPAGAYRLAKIATNEIFIPVPKTWDKKWRLVTFDIPLNRSASRKSFTQKLNEMGFFMLQRSLWVHPFPCFDQVAQVAGYYNVLRYCSLFEISAIDSTSAQRLQRHFGKAFI